MVYEDLDIVFLTKTIPDYLHDAIYLGLSQLGCNVVDFPRKGSLHGTPHPSEFHSEQLLFQLPENKLRKPNPDLMIITALMHDMNPLGPQGWMNHVRDTVDRFKPKKLIILDGQDKVQANYPALKQPYEAVFKRELFEIPYENWYQTPFAAVPEPFQFKYYPDRRFDICAVLAVSTTYRIGFGDKLLQYADAMGLKSFIYVSRKPIPRSQYLEILSDSRVAFSVRGMGFDCYRYWEIPAKGTVLASEITKLPIENDYDETMCFKFDGFGDMSDIERVLTDIKSRTHEDLQEMGVKGLQHHLRYHTPKARAEWILKTAGIV